MMEISGNDRDNREPLQPQPNDTVHEDDAHLSTQETDKGDYIMENTMRPPTALSFEGNYKENWKKWRKTFEIYMTATDLVSKPEARKVAILLHVAGEEAMEKFETFGLTDDQKKKLDDVLKAFDEFCTPKVNERVERHIFFTRVQNSGENFTCFLTDLKKLSASCDFGDLKDSLIKDRIICGITDHEIKNRLLRGDDLTLEKCIRICKAAELANIQIKTMDNESKVDAIKSKNTSEQSQRKNSTPSKFNETNSQRRNSQEDQLLQGS